MKSTAGNSSAGKWFSLFVIAATGVVASLPFHDPSNRSSQSNGESDEKGVSLRISSEETGEALDNAPRPVAAPRIQGATLQQPARATPSDGEAPSDYQPQERRSIPPGERPSWETSGYPRNATGVGVTPPPPFAHESRDDEARDDEARDDEARDEESRDVEARDDEAHDSDAVATSDDGNEPQQRADGTPSGPGTFEYDELPPSRYATDNSSAGSFVYGTDDAGENNEVGDETAEREDVLPAPRSENLANEDVLPAPGDRSSSSDDELPPPRPRLTISEDKLPAPRSTYGNSRLADDGFRPAVGRTVSSADRPSADEDDNTIRPPVTRLVRLGPPDPKSAPIRAPQFHVIRDGDSLDGIAKHYWGDASRWRAIYSANRDLLSDPDLLPIGVSLKIPNDAFYQSLRRK